MAQPIVAFHDRLGGAIGNGNGLDQHTHSHDGVNFHSSHGHGHGPEVNEHGHTHEHLEHAGEPPTSAFFLPDPSEGELVKEC